MPLTKVSSGVIAANAVVDSFGTQSITGDKIGLGAITGNTLAPNIINANNIVNASITGAKLAANTVSGDVIGQNAISSNNIVSVSGSTITANTVANSAFTTGAVESYMRANNLDFGLRNRIINGDMRIDQRNVGASKTISDNGDITYTVDRWAAYGNQTSKFTVQQDSSANTVAGFTSSLKVTSLSGYSVLAGDTFSMRQNIEGFNMADLNWGTANAKTITLSFWVRSSLTGTFGGSLRNSGNNYSYPFSYTILAANTWEQKIITVAGPTAGTWIGATNGIGTHLIFSLGTGTTGSGTAGSWSGTNYESVTGGTSIVGTNGATWYITGVQLEEGSTPTSFEYRQFTTEFALCQRYFETNTPYGTAPANGVGVQWMVSATPNSVYTQYVPFVVSKRATPTMTVYRADGETNGQWAYFNGSSWVSASTNLSAQITGFRGGINSNPTTHAAWIISGGWTASAEL